MRSLKGFKYCGVLKEAVRGRTILLAVLVNTIIAFSHQPVLAQATIFSAQSGDWSSVATWLGGVIPGPVDSVVIRAYVEDNLSGQPVANATVEITVGGPETVTLNSGPSGADGWAEATWNTQKPNRRGQGGTTPGNYTASTTNVTATGYHWDGVTTKTTFTMQ